MTHALSCDVAIIGGGIMGTATAWFLAREAPGTRIVLIERDPAFRQAATSLSNSCIRQQFSSALNVRISQVTADFLARLPEHLEGVPDVPRPAIRNFGYLYLADTARAAEGLERAVRIQREAGAGTVLLWPEELARRFPFLRLDDIVLGSHNTKDEGYFDSIALFDALRRGARRLGVTSLAGEVVAIERAGARVTGLRLADGRGLSCGTIVNAAGTRGAAVCAMAGLSIPVEPRKRMTWVFLAERPLDRDLPLTIDPSGIHVRQDGTTTYMAGGHSQPDGPVDPDDFELEPELWQEVAWPAIAGRIPQFEAIRVVREWAGHYDFNHFDHNAIVGAHPALENFLVLNGFSGHGVQQAPAMGRAIAELIAHGAFRSLDLAPLGFERLLRGERFEEAAVI